MPQLRPQISTHREFSEIVDLWLYMNRAIHYYLGTRHFHLVRYEDLVPRPGATLTDLCMTIGIDYDPSMLEYHECEIPWGGQNNARFTPGDCGHDDRQRLRHWQINQSLFDGSGRWRSEMTERDKEVFKSIAGRQIMDWGMRPTRTGSVCRRLMLSWWCHNRHVAGWR